MYDYINKEAGQQVLFEKWRAFLFPYYSSVLLENVWTWRGGGSFQISLGQFLETLIDLEGGVLSSGAQTWHLQVIVHSLQMGLGAWQETGNDWRWWIQGSLKSQSM